MGESDERNAMDKRLRAFALRLRGAAPQGAEVGRPSPYVHLTEDRHQQALYRLAAIGQYLYDTMNGDAGSSRERPDPLPKMAMEPVREAQRLIDLAIKNGQRTRRRCLGGELALVERPGPQAPGFHKPDHPVGS